MSFVDRSQNIRRIFGCRYLLFCAFRGLNTLGAVCLLTLATAVPSLAEDATHFWISISNVATSGPPIDQAEIVPIDTVVGSTRYLNIWAQPPAGKSLQNFSLNLVGDPSLVGFASYQRTDGQNGAALGSVIVNNPVSNGHARFEQVRDSFNHTYQYVYTGPDNVPVTTTINVDPVLVEGNPAFPQFPYGIEGMQGFSFGNSTGIGGASCDNGTTCSTSGGAWLVATVAVRATGIGSAAFHLQVGSLGMNYANEPTSHTTVAFGASTYEGAAQPTYSAYSDLEKTKTQAKDGIDDQPDFVLRSVTQLSDVVSQGGGLWTQVANGHAPTGANRVVLNGGVVTVTGAQVAGKVICNGGRLHVASLSSLAGDIAVSAPNPSQGVAGGAISGSGWINGNLTLGGGKLALTSGDPLGVEGSADITGGLLTIANGFEPPVGREFAALTAIGGIQGSLSAPSGVLADSPNFKLMSVHYMPQGSIVTSVMVTLGWAGDFNNDGRVDTTDYVVWRKTDGTPVGYSAWRNTFGRGPTVVNGDYNNDGKVDAADSVLWRKTDGSAAGYNAWRSTFGSIINGEASGTNLDGAVAVPEPTTVTLIFGAALAMTSCWRRRKPTIACRIAFDYSDAAIRPTTAVPSWRRPARLICVVFCVCVAAESVAVRSRADHTPLWWDGRFTNPSDPNWIDNNWGDLGNWSTSPSSYSPPSNGQLNRADITFNTAARNNTDFTINLGGPRTPDSLTFQSTGSTTIRGAYGLIIHNDGSDPNNPFGIYMENSTESGLALDSGPVSIQSSVTVKLEGSQTWKNDSHRGDLTVSGDVNLDTYTLTVLGARNTIIGGAISGGGGLYKDGTTSTLTLSGSTINSFTGPVTVDKGILALDKELASTTFQDAITSNVTVNSLGTLRLDHSDQLGNGTITLNGGKFDMQGFADTVGELVLNNGTIVGTASSQLGRLVDDTHRRITSNGTSSITTGQMFGSGNIQTDVQSGTLSIGASIVNFGGQAAYLTKTGGGTLVLTNGNSYSSGTYLNAGTLNLNSDSNLGSATSNLQFAGGTLQIANDVTLTHPWLVAAQGGTIDTNGHTLTYGAGIGGSGSLTKVGPGTLRLSGGQAYTGNTVVSTGAIQLVGNQNPLTASTVVVNTNGGLTFAAGTNVASHWHVGGIG